MVVQGLAALADGTQGGSAGACGGMQWRGGGGARPAAAPKACSVRHIASIDVELIVYRCSAGLPPPPAPPPARNLADCAPLGPRLLI